MIGVHLQRMRCDQPGLGRPAVAELVSRAAYQQAPAAGRPQRRRGQLISEYRGQPDRRKPAIGDHRGHKDASDLPMTPVLLMAPALAVRHCLAAADPRYIALDSRRGMDYHRLRPQSVPHGFPKRGISQAGDGVVTIDLAGPVLDPESDADRVYGLLIEAMEAVRQAMVAIRNDLAKAVRAAGLWYHEPTPRPTAARASKMS